MTEYRDDQRQQAGSVLILALVLMMALAALAVSAMQTTVQEQHMSVNTLDQNVSFQAADSALRVGEDYLQGLGGPVTGTANCTAPCVATDYGVLPASLPWGTARADSVTTSAGTFAHAASPPEVIIEDIGRFKTGISTVSSGTGYGGVTAPESQFYRVTARGVGMTSTSQTMVQSVYALQY